MFRTGESNSFLLHVENRVELSHENVAQDPGIDIRFSYKQIALTVLRKYVFLGGDIIKASSKLELDGREHADVSRAITVVVSLYVRAV